MARKKRTSPEVDAAKIRAASLESIDAALDLGNGQTLASYNAAIAATEKQLNTYNTKLSELDEMLNNLEESETALADLSERMLAGVASKFGKNSTDYEKAGGKRKSEIQRGPKKAAKGAAPSK
jgi:hypothetical protein